MKAEITQSCIRHLSHCKSYYKQNISEVQSNEHLSDITKEIVVQQLETLLADIDSVIDELKGRDSSKLARPRTEKILAKVSDLEEIVNDSGDGIYDESAEMKVKEHYSKFVPNDSY